MLLRREWELARLWPCFHDGRMRAATISYLALNVSSVALPLILLSVTDLCLCLLLLALACLLLTGYRHYQYSLQGIFLGFVCGTSIYLGVKQAAYMPKLQSFCLYAWIYSNFHFFEFFMTGLTNRESLRPDSFLLNHSREYWIAAVISWLEFAIEAFLFPDFYYRVVTFVGLTMCVCGEVIRKLAMCHASAGFTHQIAYQKRKKHKLVTRGVYSLWRHPGYLGWFLWSTGTQVVLCNPMCFVAYVYITFRFFEGRIYEEERYLVEFFGQRYTLYQRRVPSGIPFVYGYQRRLSE